jgi:hypothetical protein
LIAPLSLAIFVMTSKIVVPMSGRREVMGIIWGVGS